MTQPPVLLVHGLGSSFEHGWQATGWVDVLEGEGRDVVPVHLPGHGPGATVETASDSATARILAAAAAFPQVDAVGFSAGGHALLGAAVEEPGRFRRIAVLGVGDGLLGEEPAAGTGAAIAAGLEADDEPEESLPRIIRRLVDSASNQRSAVAEFLRTEGRRLSRDDLARITAPALVVIGDHDFAGPADALAASLPDAELVTLRGVDHFATPGEFACIDAVVRFLDAG